MFLDIHSHILHNIDDGAPDLSSAIDLLQTAYNQGITDVLLTPHFYPMCDALEDHKQTANANFNELKNAIKNRPVPNIYLGNEVAYYKGIGKATLIDQLTLNGSRYILLEPDFSLSNKNLQADVLQLLERGFIPIIAHIERYYKESGFRDFLRFLKANSILTQVNATSFFSPCYTKVLKKLIKNDIVTFLASDTHSKDVRPTLIKPALDRIELLYGTATKQKLIDNSQQLYSKIINKEATV